MKLYQVYELVVYKETRIVIKNISMLELIESLIKGIINAFK